MSYRSIFLIWPPHHLFFHLHMACPLSSDHASTAPMPKAIASATLQFMPDQWRALSVSFGNTS
uniref:Uncharacterized protein n=1 Tax=Arundo donax TaxID=35708 RepID=A0A0A9A006_ARUDO